MDGRKILADYFSFTRKERIGLTILMSVIVITWVLPELVNQSSVNGDPGETDSGWLVAIGELKNQHQGGNSREDEEDKIRESQFTMSTESSAQLFEFDPNTLSSEGWSKLGLSSKTIRTIKNYLDKGGKFYKPEDLAKIYGLRKADYERLRKYIMIRERKIFDKISSTTSSINKVAERPVNSIVDINNADSLSIVMLKGIGPKLASRIIAYRNKLGGFYEIDQLKQTYGLPDSTFRQIRSRLTLGEGQIRKININTAGKDALKTHPYIRWNLANAIVEFRVQHGRYENLEKLLQIALIDQETFNRIRHYLTID